MVDEDLTCLDTTHADDTTMESIRIGADGPEYRAILDRRFNKRFSALTGTICSTRQLDKSGSDGGREAVSEGRRLVVTSGGHCLEGFVSDPDVRVIVDVSSMKRIYYYRNAALSR